MNNKWVMFDEVQGSSFDPVEANFLSTVLKDCYDQLYNVGGSAETKTFKLPELLNIETRTREGSIGSAKHHLQGSESLGRAVSDVSRNFTRSLIGSSKEVKRLNKYSNLDDNASWMERLVEAHGYLEDTYIKTVEKAKGILEAQKDLHEKANFNLEKQGIRTKTFELSRAIADRENALHMLSNAREKNILDGLREVVLLTSEELKREGTYEILKERNSLETAAMGKASSLINRELQMHDQCNALIESIIEEKKRSQLLIKEREAQAANLKDYLKEQKVLRSLEINYIKKFYDASLEQIKMANDKKFQELQNKEECILKQIKDDIKANEVMESFLNKEILEKQELLKWWTDKYGIEVERKTAELKDLQDQLDKDQEAYELMKKRIVEYEQVIEDDKRQKAILQSRKDLEKLYEMKAVQIQKWWRGLRVRRCIGPFKKRKKKKSKAGGDTMKKGK